MAWTIKISPTPRKTLAKLDRFAAKRIFDFLYKRLAALDEPRGIGQPLHGARFGELWRYRVGDYRIICQIQDAALVILAVRIGHRREVYR